LAAQASNGWRALVAVHARHLLHEDAERADPVHEVGGAQRGPGQLGRAVRIVEDPHPQRAPLAALPDAPPAVDQLGEVELPGVLVARRVRALHLAELALEAGVHHLHRLLGRDPVGVAVVLLVDGLEEEREAVAVLEAHAAAVTDLEGALHLGVDRLRLPVDLVGGVVGEPGSGVGRAARGVGGHGASLPWGAEAHQRRKSPAPLAGRRALAGRMRRKIS
jgi:hypothetical protein